MTRLLDSSERPLAIDLYCGLGGWTEGLLAEGYRVVGFDIERHRYAVPDASENEDGAKNMNPVPKRGWSQGCAVSLGMEGASKRPDTRIIEYPAQFVLQDVLTLHGSQFRSAALIVASPPCQAYSYRAMPWSRAKALPPPDNTLFEACFRIQREAIEAAGHFIPLVVENVRGAQKWVGRARWNFGSFYLWGDVPALMPMTVKRPAFKGGDRNMYRASGGHKWNQPEERSPHWTNPDEGAKNAGFRFDGSGRSFQSESVKNTGGSWFNIGSPGQKVLNQNPVHQHIKQSGVGGSSKRKAASAMIAKIPLVLARHIGWAWHPERLAA